MATKIWKILSEAKAGGYGEVTLGALDPVQIAN
jgi:isocitrate lyase